MTVNVARNPTLLDMAKRQDPDGKVAFVVEILGETNEILDDMVWMEGNLVTGNRVTLRSSIPEPTWRKYYGGVQPNKSTTVQTTDNVGNMEAYAEIDKDMVELNSNVQAWRLSEEKAFIEGLSQEMATTLFYGNEDTAPEEFTGFSPRFNSLSSVQADNIIVGGGIGIDNNSIWLIVWGPNTTHGIVPKGSVAGLQITDKGIVTLEDASDGSNTGRMEVYRTHYQWKAGLTIRDWRYIVRIPNIDKSLLEVAHSSGANLPDLMFQAMRKVPNLSGGVPVFYMARDLASMLARQVATDGASSFLTADSNAGDLRWTERFHGIPIRRVDALSADEALVT